VLGIYAIWDLFREYGKLSLSRIEIDWVFLYREPMWFVLVCCLLLYLFMPWSLIGWHKADVRIIPLIFIVTLALPTAIRGGNARALFTIGWTGIVLASLFPIASALLARSNEVVEFTAGMDYFPKNVRFLTIASRPSYEDREVEHGFNSLLHANSYYAIRRGGAPHDSLAWNNTAYTVWYRSYRDKRDFPSALPNPSEASVRELATKYDAVILWDQQPGTEEHWQHAGFETIFQQRRLMILAKPLTNPPKKAPDGK
jgi:hypothetical protein